jgi:DNA-binding response OmpR family regulator
MRDSSDFAASEARRDGAAAHDGARRAAALLVDVDPALAALIGEWLDDAGVDVVAGDADGARERARGVDLAIVDVPFPRQGGSGRLRGLAHDLPGTPILALSPTFFAGVAASGAVAHELGVAGVLATPVRRDALVAAVRRLLGRAP